MSSSLPPPAAPASGEATTPNLIDLETPTPQPAPASQNPFAPPVNTNDISVQLASMSKSVRFLYVTLYCQQAARNFPDSVFNLYLD